MRRNTLGVKSHCHRFAYIAGMVVSIRNMYGDRNIQATVLSHARDSRSYKNMFPGLICGWKEISIVKNRNLIDSFTACALCCRMSGEKRLSYL